MSPRGLLDSELSTTARQDDLYAFPYHHLPWRDSRGGLCLGRNLSWGGEYLCYITHIARVVAAFGGKSVLDVGCGDGRFLTMLSSTKFERLVGIDRSARAIAYARAFAPTLEWHVCDASEVEGVFDVVTAIEVMEHIPDRNVDQFMNALARCVAPGGRAVICVPTVALPFNAKHFRHYDEELLRDHLGRAPELSIEFIDYLIRDRSLAHWLSKLTSNRFWSVDVPALRPLVWRAWWRGARLADSNNGRHAMAVLRKL